MFIVPKLSFMNYKYARSKQYPEKYLSELIENVTSIVDVCVISGGVWTGGGSMIDAGSILNKDIPDGEIWFGNPARFLNRIVL